MEKSRILRKVGDLTRERADSIARNMLDQGKPLAEVEGRGDAMRRSLRLACGGVPADLRPRDPAAIGERPADGAARAGRCLRRARSCGQWRHAQLAAHLIPNAPTRGSGGRDGGRAPRHRRVHDPRPLPVGRGEPRPPMVPPTTRQGRWSYYPSEVTADAFVDWAKEHGAQLLFMQSGKPNQNAFVERFNGSVSRKRHECDLGLQNMNQSKHEGARMKSIHTLLVVLGLSFGLVGQADSREWYVSASASLGGDGSIQAPFNTLAAVQQASGPGDTIFVVPSPIQNAPLDGGIALKPGQRLIGAGPPVVGAAAPVPIKGPGLPIQSAGPLAVALATLPQITNTSTANNSGDAVTLANGTEVANLVISGTQRGGIYGLNVGGVNVHGNDISMANLSCTVGFTVQPQNIGTYIPGSGVFNPGGVPTAWAAILIDATQGAVPVTIANNYVHDGVCNNGIDVRAMGTSQIYAKVIGNGV